MARTDRQTKMLNTRIAVNFYVKLQKVCEERNMTSSEAVREALSQWMEGSHKQDTLEEFRKMLMNQRAMDAAWAVLKRGD